MTVLAVVSTADFDWQFPFSSVSLCLHTHCEKGEFPVHSKLGHSVLSHSFKSASQPALYTSGAERTGVSSQSDMDGVFILRPVGFSLSPGCTASRRGGVCGTLALLAATIFVLLMLSGAARSARALSVQDVRCVCHGKTGNQVSPRSQLFARALHVLMRVFPPPPPPSRCRKLRLALVDRINKQRETLALNTHHTYNKGHRDVNHLY